MHEEHVLAPELVANLTGSFDEGLTFDVTDGPANFGDDHIGPWLFVRLKAHAPLNLIGDVGNDLHSVAQVFATAFLADDLLVYLAGCDVGCLRQVDIQEALVVPDVQVGLCTIIGDEHFAVLEGVHGARIHVQIRIQLLHHHAQSAAGKQVAKRCGGKTFTQRGHDPTGHKDVFSDSRVRCFFGVRHGIQQ